MKAATSQIDKPKLFGAAPADFRLTCACGKSKWYSPSVAARWVGREYRCNSCSRRKEKASRT